MVWASTRLCPILRTSQIDWFLVLCIFFLSIVLHSTSLTGADIISIGAIFAVSTCGGPIIPFRGGRIDAYSAGNFGTPQPQDDLGSLTTSFQNQGFNAVEMIKLVACGHTLGGVRSSDFPELVPAGPDPNVPNIENFDTSTQFDNAV